MWAPLPQPSLRNKPQGCWLCPTPAPHTAQTHLQMFLKTGQGQATEQVGPRVESPTALRLKQQSQGPRAFALWMAGRGPSWASWWGGFLTILLPRPGHPSPQVAKPVPWPGQSDQAPRPLPRGLPGGGGPMDRRDQAQPHRPSTWGSRLCRPARDEAPGPGPGPTQPTAPASRPLMAHPATKPLSLLCPEQGLPTPRSTCTLCLMEAP